MNNSNTGPNSAQTLGEYLQPLEGPETFLKFIDVALEAQATSVAITTSVTTQPQKVGAHSWVAQPAVHVRCDAIAYTGSASDPFATKPVAAWETQQASTSDVPEQQFVDGIAKALRAKGFIVG